MIIPLLNSCLAPVLKELVAIYLRASELTEIKERYKTRGLKNTGTDESELVQGSAVYCLPTVPLLNACIHHIL